MASAQSGVENMSRITRVLAEGNAGVHALCPMRINQTRYMVAYMPTKAREGTTRPGRETDSMVMVGKRKIIRVASKGE